MVEMVAVLKRELGVKGTNLAETVEAAVAELGLDAEMEGAPLMTKAQACCRLLGSAS